MDTSTSGTPVITIDAVRRTAREVVAEFGENFVYTKRPAPDGRETCRYVHDGKPDCVAAHILTRLGVPLSELKTWEGSTVYGMEVLGQDDKARNYLYDMQGYQDAGLSWGEALKFAEGRLVRNEPPVYTLAPSSTVAAGDDQPKGS